MRKKLIALACVLCFSFALTACGNSENKENAQGTGTPSATEQPTNTPTEAPTSTPTETPTPTPTETPTPTPTPHEHSYTSAITKEATCSEVGETTYTCSCGDTYKEDIEKKNHTESEWIVVKEVAGAENGLQHKVCTVCGVELATEEIYPEVVASGKLSDATIEWKIIGTTLYVSGTGAIPNFSTTPATVKHFPEMAPKLEAWQIYSDIVEKIVIEEGITKLGKNNFAYFRNTKDIVFADSVTSIGDYACNGLGIETINFNNITKLGTQSFGELKNLRYLTIPGTINTISKYCFLDCAISDLTEIYIEEGVENIEEAAFECLGIVNCTVHLPLSLKNMADDSLSNGMTVYVKTGSYAEQAANEYKDNKALTIIVE